MGIAYALGVFGGTFDPIHIGHLASAEYVRESLGLDSILFVPAGRPWLKASRDLAPARHRMRMAELATGPNPNFSCSDMEIARPGPTYTVDTIEELIQDTGGLSTIYFIAGLDALREFGRWRRPARLLELATLIGVARPGCEDLDPSPFERISAGSSNRIITVSGPMIGVTSTAIRERVRQGRSIKYLTPASVEQYILDNRLYAVEAGE